MATQNTKKHRSKTIAKKQQKPNLKKRKLDAFVNDNNLQRKKMKMGDSNDGEVMSDKISLLKKQRDHFEKGLNVYKDAYYHYKTKYLTLLSLINETELEENETQNENKNVTNGCNDNSYLNNTNHQSITSKTVSKRKCRFRRRPKSSSTNEGNTHHDNNDKNEAGITYNTHIGVLSAPSLCVNLQNDTNGDDGNSDSDDDDATVSISDGETCCDGVITNTYIFSVSCHRCHKHFDDRKLYITHLQNHYDDKTWTTCDFGCKKSPSWDNIGNLIAHIASHTAEYPFQCTLCPHKAGTKGNHKNHWIKYHQKTDKKQRIKTRAITKKNEDINWI